MSQDQRRVITRAMTKVCLETHTLPPSLLTHLSAVPEKEGIEDRAKTSMVNLRRLIYLTIMNALNYEKAVHKLLKVQLKEEGEEVYYCYLLVFGIAHRAF